MRKRYHAFQRGMNLLALAAILLLALLPTFGRLTQAAQGAASDTWTQVCTVAGMKLVKLSLAASQSEAPAPAPKGDGMGADCPYCPLLGTFIAAVVSVVLALLAFAPVVVSLRRGYRPRAWLHLSGLGSRGPPVVSEIAL